MKAGKSRKKSIPKSATSREDIKRVAILPRQSNQKPAWRFSTVDKNGPFAWPAGQVDELKIVTKLHSFDSMTWQEIEGKEHHSISISRLSKEAQKRLQEINQDDVDALFSFHLQGRPRIFCIQDGHIAKLLWYDQEHQVCPSKKKNT